MTQLWWWCRDSYGHGDGDGDHAGDVDDGDDDDSHDGGDDDGGDGDDGDDDGGGCELCKLDHQELLTKSLALHQRLKYHNDNDDGVDDGGGGGGDDDDITCWLAIALLCFYHIEKWQNITLVFSPDEYLEGYPSSAGFAPCTCAQSMKLVTLLFIFVIKCSEMSLCNAIDVVFDAFENKADFVKEDFNINEKFWSEICLA